MSPTKKMTLWSDNRLFTVPKKNWLHLINPDKSGVMAGFTGIKN
jgi:hypothetical protein